MMPEWAFWALYGAAAAGVTRALTDDWFLIVAAALSPVIVLVVARLVDLAIDVAGGER